MAVGDPPIRPAQLQAGGQANPQLLRAIRLISSTNLTSAIVTASGRHYSVAEVLELNRDIHFSLFPAPGHAGFEEWARTKEGALKKVHS